MPLATGTHIGPYEITATIGAGGMGEVYLARDTKLDRNVAIKVLPELFAADPDRLSRFQREARTLASLNHPHIAQVHGVVEQPPALVMEFVEGEDLAQRLARGAMPLDDALPMARQIADALDAAHERGIIHRDLKPANIKIRPDGTVKVLDFGLAKAIDHPPVAGSGAVMNSPTLTSPAMTQMGVVLGTAAYMAPEQAKGKPVDKRADIWAFGCVLFEMLAGQRRFEGEDMAETLASVLTREVPISSLPSSTPAPLRALVRDCLIRDPRQRLRDIGEARRLLDRIIAGGTDAGDAPPQVSTSRVWTRALPWAIAAAALLAGGSGMMWGLRTPSSPDAPIVTRSQTHLNVPSGFFSLSRDGRKLAYTSVGGTNGFFIALRHLDELEGRPVPGADDPAEFPVFSPGGEWIAYRSRPSTIKKIRVTGGTSTIVGEGNVQAGADWGDDNTIVFSGANGLVRISADGGSGQPLTTLDSTKQEAAHVRPQFLPDGRHLLFTVLYADKREPQFAVLDRRSGSYRAIVKGGDSGRYVPSGPTAGRGHLTYGRSRSLVAIPFDLERMAPAGDEVVVVEQVSDLGPERFADYTFSNKGLMVYAKAGGGLVNLAWMRRSGSIERFQGPGQAPRDVVESRFSRPQDYGVRARLSPDGRHIVVPIRNEARHDLWVLDVDRGTQVRITFSGSNDAPVWTPDGRAVVFASTGDNAPGIYRAPADGTAQPSLVLATEKPPFPSSFSPDGRTLLFNYDGRIMLVPYPPTAGVTASPLHDARGTEQNALISPDGKLVAYSSNESGQWEIYVEQFPDRGRRARVSVNGARVARWTQDGRELIFWNPLSSGTRSMMAAAVRSTPSFDVGAPQELFRGFDSLALDVSRDGARVLVLTGAEGATSTFITITDWFAELRRRAPARE
jgi:eukaryotic-like serine/threonine-protein kinase